MEEEPSESWIWKCNLLNYSEENQKDLKKGSIENTIKKTYYENQIQTYEYGN